MRPDGIGPPDMQCTFFPDGFPEWTGGTGREFLACCQAHDLSALDFSAALDLGRCVAEISPAIGFLMFLGAAIFGPAFIAYLRWRERRKSMGGA